MTPRLRHVRPLVVSVVATLVVAEVVVRAVDPTPRLQVIDLDLPSMGHVEQDGVTLFWDTSAGDLIRGGPCRPGQVVVGLVGDSVQMVSGPTWDLPRTADALRDRLRGDGVDACVLDASWAGWKPDQELAMLRRLHAAHPLDVAVIGVWKTDARYVRTGDLLLDGELVAHDADGLPLPPLPMPRFLHRPLLGHAALWRYATLAVAVPGLPARPPDVAYRDALAWSEATGVPLIALEGVAMDRPFEASRREREAHPERWQARLAADWRAAGRAWLSLADVFGDLDVAAIRLDTCCHFDVRGHAAAGAALARPVEEALAARARRTDVTSPGTDPPGTGSGPPAR